MSLRVRYRPAAPGVVTVECVGLIVDASLPRFWVALDSPVGAASVVSVFDFTRAIVAYRRAPRLVPGAPQLKPGCFVCSPTQYPMLLARAAAIASLGVVRQVFLTQPLALEWALEEVHRSLSRSELRTGARSAL